MQELCKFVKNKAIVPERESGAHMSNRHTFLFREGLWKALGYYTDASGKIYTLEGESQISKKTDYMMADLRFTAVAGQPALFVQHFRIIPVQDEKDNEWECCSLISGNIEGRIMFMNEYIFLMYNSPDGRFSGIENLEMVDEIHYKNHGYAFMNEQKMAAWTLDWRRVK